MIYGTACSGVEAPSLAWGPLGWEPSWFCETAKFPAAVLAHRHPDVPNLGDMTEAHEHERFRPVDVAIAGTPCQSFSVAGSRSGLDDPRGVLVFVYLRLAARAGARWIIWENVPGVLSDDGGRSFGAILGALAKLGYGFAYRIFDAQNWGVAQRRRRVFVVGYLGDWRHPAAVLFERESVRWNTPKGGGSGPGVARSLRAQPQSSHIEDSDNFVAGTITTTCGDWSRDEPGSAAYVFDEAHRHDTSHTMPNAGRPPTLRVNARQDPIWRDDGAMPLDADGTSQAVQHRSAVRRLLPVECERLQGMPEVRKSTILSAWDCADRELNSATAGIRNPSVLESAWIAADERSGKLAPFAGSNLNPSRPGPAKRADVSVLIDYEAGFLQLHSLGGWRASVSIVAARTWFPLQGLDVDFVQLIALTLHVEGAENLSHWRGSASTPEKSGKPSIVVSAHEMAGYVAGAAHDERVKSASTKFTTCGPGVSIQASEKTRKILCSCVIAAIFSCIPKTTFCETTFSVRVSSVSGYTRIPWRGKPADQCPDGPRYKAIGNSMAVPVIRWIGERIQAVEAIL